MTYLCLWSLRVAKSRNGPGTGREKQRVKDWVNDRHQVRMTAQSRRKGVVGSVLTLHRQPLPLPLQRNEFQVGPDPKRHSVPAHWCLWKSLPLFVCLFLPGENT